MHTNSRNQLVHKPLRPQRISANLPVLSPALKKYRQWDVLAGKLVQSIS